MKVLVSGSTGFVGSPLVHYLVAKGHDVSRLVRRDLGSVEPEVHWDPAAGTIESSALEGIDGVVHLAGESAVGRWTARKKARILESRANGTRLLCRALADLDPPPRALICASGLDFYGDRGDALVSEETGPGSGFLAEVTAAWEAATKPATEAGIRVVRVRLGMVVGNGGGALARMLPAFRLGLGGPFGGGRQHVSWVSLTDVVRVFHHILATESLDGPVNVSTTMPVTNAEFARILGRVLSRPAVLPVPAFGLRLALGEMASMVLASVRLDPSKLVRSGFDFRYPELEGALRAELGRQGQDGREA
jgi:uncharacterized protein (TIGR01777 family)